MSKAQTDIRVTSYDANFARPQGYQGEIDDVIAQMKAEPDPAPPYWPLNMSRARHELLGFLGVLSIPNGGPSLADDPNPRYGSPEDPTAPPEGVSRYSVEYAQSRGWIPCPAAFVYRP